MKHLKEFKLFESNFNGFSGEEVAQHIIDITPDDSDIPDYFIEKYIKPNNNWILKLVDIKNILKNDESFSEYYRSGEVRYDEDEVDINDLYYDIVVYKGKLLDGYSRVSYMLRRGDDKAHGFVLE